MKNCTQCGKCCIAYSDGGLSASSSEIDYWEHQHPHIFRYVHKGEIWIDPDTKQPLTLCPFLETLPGTPLKYGCKIYLDRPEDCRHYPVTIDQMIKDDCEMIEVKDRKDFKKAQATLDKIMSDSRPPYL
ncbi:MAG: YkgJ family cysteine cluster protein [Pseudomonadales bacterium]|nr:YkgJ family cysteine cluster protein [Pseudomonadales bacterium]